MSFLPITVGIPCFQGGERLLRTLELICRCEPLPAEILIHCDGGWRPDEAQFDSLRVPVRLLFSEKPLGPGGGRDACIRASSHDLIASFDDDSLPLDSDYFDQAKKIMDTLPQAAILSPEVYLQEKPIQPQSCELRTAKYYQGSASIHRRSHYLAVRGFVPVPLAYGVEETDLSLQTHAAGFQIWESPWLRAWHDRPLADNAHQTIPWIKNEVLLAYLRYPLIAQPWGWWRAWRHWWRNRSVLKVSGLLRLVREIFVYCLQYQTYKHSYSLRQILCHLRLHPERFLIESSNGQIHIRSLP
jgi:GT2 family glycosyltransferase